MYNRQIDSLTFNFNAMSHDPGRVMMTFHLCCAGIIYEEISRGQSLHKSPDDESTEEQDDGKDGSVELSYSGF